MENVVRADITTKRSPLPVQATVEQFCSLLDEKGMRVFAVIDQAKEAQQVGLELRGTSLVVFGSPAAGTPVMDAVPLSALDLPLKVLIWDDGDGTAVSYYSPDSIANRNHLNPSLAAKLAGIDGLTDILVAGSATRTMSVTEPPPGR